MHYPSQFGQTRCENDLLDGVLAPPATDRRMTPRVGLLIRAAKLIADGVEFLCITRDVSPAGAKVRVFHPIPECQELLFETSGGNRYAVKLIWCKDEYAGLQFDNEADLHELIDDKGTAFPKRPLRLQVSADVIVRSGGSLYAAILRDISQHGARIECPQHLMLDERIGLSVAAVPDFHCIVRWRREPLYGVSFVQPLQYEQLARLIEFQVSA